MGSSIFNLVIPGQRLGRSGRGARLAIEFVWVVQPQKVGSCSCYLTIRGPHSPVAVATIL